MQTLINLFHTYIPKRQSRHGYLLDIFLFSLITIFLHFFYWHFLGFFRETSFFLTTSRWMADSVFAGAMWVNTHLYDFNIITDYLTNTLTLHNQDYITVNESCSGFKQDYQLLGLFLLYPGPWKHKLWFIPASFIVMHLTNIFRIAILTGILNYLPQQWDMWHEWVMRPFYYVVIFGIWVIWQEGFSRRVVGSS